MEPVWLIVVFTTMLIGGAGVVYAVSRGPRDPDG